MLTFPRFLNLCTIQLWAEQQFVLGCCPASWGMHSGFLTWLHKMLTVSLCPPPHYENKNVFRICGDRGLAGISHACKRFALEAHRMILREHGQLLQERAQTLLSANYEAVPGQSHRLGDVFLPSKGNPCAVNSVW